MSTLPCLTDQETNSQRGESTSQGHIANWGQSQDQNSGLMSPEAEKREGGREECGEEKKKGREEKEEEKVRGERRLGAGEVLEVNLLVKENKAGLLQTLLGTR